MNSCLLRSGFLSLLVSSLASVALAQSAPAAAAGFRQLDISAGRWIYHGEFKGGHGAHPSAWTWHEDCHWSANRVFMLCSFSNEWAGRHVDSVVVDTYDSRTHTFWHYEIFDTGRSAGKPFAARMRIDGPTRIESWTDTRHGKSVHQRIVYKFTSGDRVTVLFQRSTDGRHWQTTASGTGEKLG